jgi:hypothetical protein
MLRLQRMISGSIFKGNLLIVHHGAGSLAARNFTSAESIKYTV